MTKKAGNLPHVKLLAMSTPAILLSFSFIEVIIIIILYYNHIARPVVDAIGFVCLCFKLFKIYILLYFE